MKQGWTGLVAAPHTPFASDGALAVSVVPAQIERLVADGVAGAFVCGSTGEGPSMSVGERMRLAEEWIRHRPAGFPVMVHVGGAALPDSVALARHAEEIGADAVATLPPFYFKASSNDAVLEWCRPVAAAASGLPFLYYHLPALSGVDLPMPSFAEAAIRALPNFSGIKVSKPDLFEFQELISGFGDRLDLFWGSDETLLPALSVGAVAAVGSTYNHSAPLYRELVGAWERGDLARARALAARSVAMVRALVPGGVLPNQKALLSARGLPLGPPRAPLMSAPDGAGETLAARFDRERWWG